jgi:hypothetical protein
VEGPSFAEFTFSAPCAYGSVGDGIVIFQRKYLSILGKYGWLTSRLRWEILPSPIGARICPVRLALGKPVLSCSGGSTHQPWVLNGLDGSPRGCKYTLTKIRG